MLCVFDFSDSNFGIFGNNKERDGDGSRGRGRGRG